MSSLDYVIMFDVCKLSDEKHLCDEKNYTCFDLTINE